MPGMTWSDIYTELGNLFDANSATRVQLWAKQGYHAFVSERRWSWLEATPAAVSLVASQQAYSLAGTTPLITDFGGIISVRLELSAAGTQVKLRSMDPQTFDEATSHSRVNGVPAFYSIAGGVPDATPANIKAGGQVVLNVWPIPTAAANQGTGLILRYWRTVDSVEFTASTDLPIVPIRHQWAVVLKAAEIGNALNGDQESAQAYSRLYQAAVQRAIQEDNAIKPVRDNERIEIEDSVKLDPRVQGQGLISPPTMPYPIPDND